MNIKRKTTTDVKLYDIKIGMDISNKEAIIELPTTVFPNIRFDNVIIPVQ